MAQVIRRTGQCHVFDQEDWVSSAFRIEECTMRSSSCLTL
jgi:hypothetical protein